MESSCKGRRKSRRKRKRRKRRPHLIEVVLGDLKGSIEEVQDVAGVLDAVLGRLLRGGEAVVAGAAEVLVAAGAVLQPIGLPGHDGLLLGDTARGGSGHGGVSAALGGTMSHPPQPTPTIR